jgi:hypothetical protein
MARARVEIGLGIVVRSLVLVLDEQTDRRAECYAMLDTRLELYEIFFVALSIRSSVIV